MKWEQNVKLIVNEFLVPQTENAHLLKLDICWYFDIALEVGNYLIQVFQILPLKCTVDELEMEGRVVADFNLSLDVVDPTVD